MTPETAALATAVAFALVREVLWAVETRRRRRGQLRTRSDDTSGNTPTS